MKQFGSFALDISNECLWKNGAQINLPPKPFAVLRFLVENPGRLITHDELLDALWPQTYVQPQVLRTYVLELRKVLGDDLEHPRFIQTFPKRGYCFVAPVLDSVGQQPVIAPNTPALPPTATGIVAREKELAELASHALLAARGERQTVFITGTTGIGKTALADAFCQQLPTFLPSGMARGQCIDGLAMREDFYPVAEALNQLCASEGDRVYRVLSTIFPAFLPASARESEIQPSSALQTAARPTVGSLCEALEEIAREKQLTLVFEDIQWADDCTLALISALARRRSPSRLLVLATFRPRDISANPKLKALKQDLLMRRLCAELELAALGRSGIRQLLTRELRQEVLPHGLDGFVYQHSEGNPLFALALLEHLISERFLHLGPDEHAARWERRVPFTEIEVGVPARVEQMISLEMERLNPAQQRILECASLMRVVFPAWAVAAALEADRLATEAACEELANRFHFVHRAGYDDLPDGSRSAFFVFSHGLYREVLYQRQGAALRSVRHNRIAERLGDLFAERKSSVAREMAMHYEEAGNWPRAVSSLRSSARHAYERHAYSEAVRILQHALRLTDNMSGLDRGAVANSILDEIKTASNATGHTQMDASRTRPQKLDELWTGT